MKEIGPTTEEEEAGRCWNVDGSHLFGIVDEHIEVNIPVGTLWLVPEKGLSNDEGNNGQLDLST